MRKTLVSLLLMSAVLLCACNFASDVNNDQSGSIDYTAYIHSSDAEGLTPEELYLLKTAYRSDDPQKLYVSQYLGNSNGSYAVMIRSDDYAYPQVVGFDVVDDIFFSYFDGGRIQIYNSGEYYSLAEAYFLEIIDHDFLASIHQQHIQYSPHMYYPIKTLRAPSNTMLSDEEYSEILSAYKTANNLADDVDCYVELVARFDSSYVGFYSEKDSDSVRTYIYTVEGIQYKYHGYDTLSVYNNGKFYSLQEAFDNSLIGYDELVSVRSCLFKDPYKLFPQFAKDWVKHFGSTAEWRNVVYYGDYSGYMYSNYVFLGYYVFCEYGKSEQATEITIGEKTFASNTDFAIYVYDYYEDGGFISLSDAYESGIVAEDELSTILAVHNYHQQDR